MLKNVEEVAIASGLHLESKSGPWSADTEWPHIAPFRYALSRFAAKSDALLPGWSECLRGHHGSVNVVLMVDRTECPG